MSAIAIRIALADLADDAVHFICAVALIGAMIGPLLVLISVKAGVIGVLLGDLRDLPDNREIKISGDHAFSLEDVADVKAWSETAFAAPQSAAIITGDIRLKAVNGRRFVSGRVEPTGEGDPLTNLGANLAINSIILSAGFARRLEIAEGDRVHLDLVRYGTLEGAASPELTVSSVLPATAGSGLLALMAPEAIDWMEAYSYDYAIPKWGIDEGAPLSDRRVSYEKMRIYAREIEQVAALEARIEERFAVSASSSAGEIAVILRLESNLGSALTFVAAAGVGGLFCALLALFWGAIRRKRLTLSLLSLMGAHPRILADVPILQALLVSIAGFAAGVGVFALISASINVWFDGMVRSGREVSVLPLEETGLVFGGLLAVSALAAAIASYAAMRVDPALVIRET